VCVYIYIYIDVAIYIYVCVCMTRVCFFLQARMDVLKVLISGPADALDPSQERERERERERKRPAHTHTHTHTYIYIESERGGGRLIAPFLCCRLAWTC